jgi:hypothetical protein
VPARGKCLGGDKAGDACADNANILLLDHGSALPSDIRGTQTGGPATIGWLIRR